MTVSIIAAIGENRELGRDNKLLWNIPEDMKRFRQLTQGHAVIMGRKTYESIGHPLPNRCNIIVTRNLNTPFNHLNGVRICDTLEKAVAEGQKYESKNNFSNSEMFICGGSSIYEQAMPLADKLYLTVVHAQFEADKFFPDYSIFKKEIFRQESQNSEFKFTFLELVK
jgi:dihydrofolate reductase